MSATRCNCCDLPAESCGLAYGKRAGVDIKAIDQAVARLAGIRQTRDTQGRFVVTGIGADQATPERHEEQIDKETRQRFDEERKHPLYTVDIDCAGSTERVE